MPIVQSKPRYLQRAHQWFINEFMQVSNVVIGGLYDQLEKPIFPSSSIAWCFSQVHSQRNTA